MRQRWVGAPAPLEKANQQAVVDHWRLLGRPGTLVAAIPNEMAHGQPGLTEGLADLLVMGPGLPVGFIELKRGPASPVSAAQVRFSLLCLCLGVPYALAIGRDEPIAVLERWGVVKRAAA